MLRHLLIFICLTLMACGPAFESLPRLAQVEIDPDADMASARSEEDTVAPEDQTLADLVAQDTDAASVSTAPVDPTIAENDASTAAGNDPFGFLRRLRGGPVEPEAGPTEPATDPSVPVTDASEIAPGSLLPYGTLVRVCDIRKSDLGTEVARYPERGRGYRLYDTDPSSIDLRTHYLTGFQDKCARQFTAALAIFGETSVHEAVRYDRSNRDLAYTETDEAYERVKSRVCGVVRNEPCGEKHRRALDDTTVFVSVYERFVGNPRWADMLLHEGEVLTKALKER